MVYQKKKKPTKKKKKTRRKRHIEEIIIITIKIIIHTASFFLTLSQSQRHKSEGIHQCSRMNGGFTLQDTKHSMVTGRQQYQVLPVSNKFTTDKKYNKSSKDRRKKKKRLSRFKNTFLTRQHSPSLKNTRAKQGSSNHKKSSDPLS